MSAQQWFVEVPGSTFGQKEGTYHFRISFLPPAEELEDMVKRIDKFHGNFIDKYM